VAEPDTTTITTGTEAQLFERFIEASRQMRHFMDSAAASLGLTVPQAHGLHLFSRPRPMGAAAEAMRCDASYITHIADDLESLGLAQRSTDPNDRRVKQMTLTAKGRALHRRLEEQLHRANPLAVSLDADEQEALVALLRRLPSINDET
jgi:DNA-binding MarR family transcriptional regulator